MVFKPSSPHLYPNIDRVPPRSLVMDGKNKVLGIDFLKWLIFSNICKQSFWMLSWRNMQCRPRYYQLLGKLSKGVFKRLTSTRSKMFSLKICLYAAKVVLISVFSFIGTIYRNIWAKPLPMQESKRRSSKTSYGRTTGELTIRLTIDDCLTVTIDRSKRTNYWLRVFVANNSTA